MKYFPLLFCCILSLYTTKIYTQVTADHFRIFSVKHQKEVGIAEIAADMQSYDVLFFGEEHNDSVTHYLEEQMLVALFEKFGTKTVLSLEMFDRDVQTVMDEYLRADIREKNFKKDARAWNNYRDYRPMVEFAKAQQLDVICANAPSRYTNLVGRKGQTALMALSKEAKKSMAPLPYDTATGAYYEKLKAIFSPGTHSSTADTSINMPPPMTMGDFNLIMSQSLWDATMAYSIASYWKKNTGKKILQVNGRFHSDEGFAIVTQLKKYNSRIRPLIISSATDENFPEIDWSLYKHLGDYIIITDPNVPKTFKD